VQVNGKLRAKLEVAPGISEAEATRLAVDAVSVEPSRVIAKPPKLVNIVSS
jgi:hypothetical protein